MFSRQPESSKKKQYTFGEELGKGAYATVKRASWKGQSPPIDVAVKIIKKKAVVGHEEDIQAEVTALDGIQHPNVIRFYEYFESKKTHYMSFEIANGGEVFERICERGKFSEADAVKTIRNLLEGLAYLHDHNVVHRDIKPEKSATSRTSSSDLNSLIYRTADSDELIIADFGIAQRLKSDDDVLTTLAGSPGYAAPEVLNRTGHSKPVDVWACGIVAYTMLCGYLPFRSSDREALIAETNKAQLTFPDRYWSKTSAVAREFILSVVKPDPKDRPTARQALQHPWLTMHRADSSVDLSAGLRENWNPRQRWRAAFAAIAATNRFKVKSASTTPTPESSSDTDDDGYGTPEEAPASPVSPSQRAHDSAEPPDMAAIAQDVTKLKV